MSLNTARPPRRMMLPQLKPTLLPGSEMALIQRRLLTQLCAAIAVATGIVLVTWFFPDSGLKRGSLAIALTAACMSALLWQKLWTVNNNLGKILRGHPINGLIVLDLPPEQRFNQTNEEIKCRMLVVLGSLLLKPAEGQGNPEVRTVIEQALKRAGGPKKTPITLPMFQAALETIQRNSRLNSAAALLLERLAGLRGTR